jgi:hypothetical protein
MGSQDSDKSQLIDSIINLMRGAYLEFYKSVERYNNGELEYDFASTTKFKDMNEVKKTLNKWKPDQLERLLEKTKKNYVTVNGLWQSKFGWRLSLCTIIKPNGETLETIREFQRLGHKFIKGLDEKLEEYDSEIDENIKAELNNEILKRIKDYNSETDSEYPHVTLKLADISDGNVVITNPLIKRLISMDMLLTLDITGLNLDIQLDGVISKLTYYMNSTLIMLKDDNGKCRIESHQQKRVRMDMNTKEKAYESKPYSYLEYDLNTVNQIMNLYPATRYTTGKSNKPLKWWLIELMNIQCTALRAKLLLENKGKDTEVPYDYFVAHATVMEIYRRQDRMNISTRVYDTNGKGEREDPYGILHIHNCSDEDCTITVLKRNDEADRRQSLYERAIADGKLMLKIDNLPILEYLAYQATKATSKDALDEFTIS